MRYPSSLGRGAVYEYRQNEYTQTNFPPPVQCKPAGGSAFWSPPGFDFVQAPELERIYILNIAGPHSWRVVYMDGRAHPESEDLRLTYLGHSVGHWEEDTLVIDSVGFNEKTWIQGSFPTTEQLHLIERISRPALNLLTYRVTIRRSRGVHRSLDDRLEQYAVARGRRNVRIHMPGRQVLNRALARRQKSPKVYKTGRRQPHPDGACEAG